MLAFYLEWQTIHDGLVAVFPRQSGEANALAMQKLEKELEELCGGGCPGLLELPFFWRWFDGLTMLLFIGLIGFLEFWWCFERLSIILNGF